MTEDSIGNTSIQIKRTGNGNLQAVRGKVQLSIKRKEIVIIKGTPSITSSGYDRLNQVAGLSLVLPKRVEVPMHGMQPNPFFVIDEKSGAVKFVMAKMSAIGYSPVGSMCVSEQTLLFDLSAYFKMDAIAKLKYSNGLGRIANKEFLTDEEKKYGLFLPMLNEDIGIWLDSRHEDFMKLMSEHQQRQRFAERIAFGILRRNCLRHHPSIAVSVVDVEAGEALVTVMGYRHDIDNSGLHQIAEGESEEPIDRIAEVVTTSDIQKEDMSMSSSDSSIGEAVAEEAEEKDEPISERDRTMIRISEIRGIMGLEKYHVFYEDKVESGRPITEFSDEELSRYLEVLEGEFNNESH